MVRWVLAKKLIEFYEANPYLRLRILADNQVNSLAAGEADIALRMFKPDRGDLIARKMQTAYYAFFASAHLALHPEIPGLGLTGSLARLPEQQYMDRAFANRPPRLLVEDVESLGQAVESGLGVALLPRRFATRLMQVVEVTPNQIGALASAPFPSRSLWLIVHHSKQHLPKVRAVIRWLETALSTNTSQTKSEQTISNPSLPSTSW